MKHQHSGRHSVRFVLILLAIEFLDEFVFGAKEAAWPLIRDDLGLTYIQIGLLFSVPSLVSSIIEPVLGILGDVWKRRLLIIGGGVFFGLALAGAAFSRSFELLMISTVMLFPASGAFVSLSQATLMDIEPDRHENNMAKWTFAGSVGVVAGPLALGAAYALGLQWRSLFVFFAGLTLLLLLFTWRLPFPQPAKGQTDFQWETFINGWKDALKALRKRQVLKWLVLLEFSDLMLDILYGFLALYFVDVLGSSPAVAGSAVLVWAGVGLIGDLLLIPLLEKVDGLAYLRVSVMLELILYPMFLVVSALPAKFVILGFIGLFNAGWYAILQGQLYSSMPGRSGTTMAVTNLFGIITPVLPFMLGVIAEQVGLNAAMWMILLGPVVLFIGLVFRRGAAA